MYRWMVLILMLSGIGTNLNAALVALNRAMDRQGGS